jgi:restriction system protein
MSSIEGPQFINYFRPVLQALESAGGSARPAEVAQRVAESENISEAQRTELLSSGQSRFENRVHWARFYLAKAGYIDASTRGVWVITDTGRAALQMQHSDALRLFKQVHEGFQQAKAEPVAPEIEVQRLTEAATEQTYRDAFLTRLQALSPNGFERFCRRLLLESGFQSVTVTGRSGDGGIDAIGLLQMNPLVSTKVLVQCKRYAGVVTVSTVRDFRGAMSGRSENGIVMTTGTFTGDARKEAVREGVPPIELVDGTRLLELCEQFTLGLTPVQTFDVDEAFFQELSD